MGGYVVTNNDIVLIKEVHELGQLHEEAAESFLCHSTSEDC